MRSLFILLMLLVGAFYLVGLFIAPSQPNVREFYTVSACPQLDKLSPELCAPIRRAQPAE